MARQRRKQAKPIPKAVETEAASDDAVDNDEAREEEEAVPVEMEGTKSDDIEESMESLGAVKVRPQTGRRSARQQAGSESETDMDSTSSSEHDEDCATLDDLSDLDSSDTDSASEADSESSEDEEEAREEAGTSNCMSVRLSVCIYTR